MNPHYTLKSILIPLTQNKTTRVSPADADLWRVQWYAGFRANYANGGGYWAQRNVKVDGKRRTEIMHRVILSRMLGRPLGRFELVDHIHGDTLDNRRSQIRLSNTQQNCMNKRKHSNNKSGFKGVYWHKSSGKWYAAISYNGVREHLGSFATAELASIAYNEAAAKHHKEFARTR